MQAGDHMLQQLREWGVHRIYGYPGDGISGLLGAIDRLEGDIEFIQARHEELACAGPSQRAIFRQRAPARAGLWKATRRLAS